MGTTRAHVPFGPLGWIATVVILACWLGVVTDAAEAQDELFVTNRSGNSVTVYPRTAFGNAGPIRTILGGNTGLNGPAGIIQDVVHGELLVANSFGGTVTVYPLNANGNVAPLRTLNGFTFNPVQVALDLVHDEIFVVGAANVLVYSRTASGNATPLRTLQGFLTQLAQASDISLDLIHDEMVIVNQASNLVSTFARTASGNTAPLRFIQGVNTLMAGSSGVALDLVNNEIFVTNNALSSVTVYPRTASGNVAPSRTIQGNFTGLSLPVGLSLDVVNNELVVTSSLNILSVFPRNASGNTFPLRTISGPSTSLNVPNFVTLTTNPPLFSSILPLSRSHQAGTFITAFATIINFGAFSAQQCLLTPPANAPAFLGPFIFQTTDPKTNAPTGTPNTPVNIVGQGGLQTFVFGFTPTGPILETSLAINFVCDNTVPAAFIAGVSDLTLVIDTKAVPDTIALISTVSGDGIVHINSPTGTQFFAIGTANVGASGSIVVSADTGNQPLPITLTVCETDVVGACLAPPTSSVTVPQYAAGTTRSFAFFVTATGSIVFDPAVNRIFARLTDPGAPFTTRGSTSTAVCTTPNFGC